VIASGGVRAYGARAREYAAHVRDVPLFIVSDDALGARDELLEVRRKGADAAVMLLLDEPRADLSRKAAADVYRQLPDYDLRRAYLESIQNGSIDVAGATLLERCTFDPVQMAQMQQLLWLAGTVVVRSFEDLRRVRANVGSIRCNIVRWFPEREIPRVESSRARTTIVLWCPEDEGDLAAIGAFAFEQHHWEVVIVARSAPSFPTSFRFVQASGPDVAEVLASAACIVDLGIGDPSWSCAFGRLGLPIAAASTSGALEMLDGVSIFEPWSFRSVAEAVAEALGRGPARLREAPTTFDIVRGLETFQVEPPMREPLVSIVIPTYNRRARVERAVRRLCSQQYSNIEIIVSNDGGENVDHLAAYDSRVRVIDGKVNRGPASAINAGLREAKGEYVEWVADDDVLFPDHILRCVEAVERTGARAVHTDTLLCSAMVNEDGVETVVYNMDRFNRTVDPTEAYAYHQIARFLIRREDLLALGLLAEDLFACDIEILIRIAKRFDFVHVPAFTSETWLRLGEEQFSTQKDRDHAVEMETLFARHPAPGRPYVAALRKRTLENLRAGAGKVTGF